MDRNRFKLIHSELIQQVQCIENNLKNIYAAMHKGNFKSNLKSVEKMNLGKIARCWFVNDVLHIWERKKDVHG